MANDSVIIVGGGIIGASTAWYLAKHGKSVTIVDAEEFGKGCSHGNCGLISPSHVVPLPRPGALTSGLSYMFKSNSPFYIKPTLNPKRIAWFLKFAGNCNKSDMMAGSAGRSAILDSSSELYSELFEEQSFQCDYDDIGTLFICKTQKGLDTFSTENDTMDKFDRGGRFVSGPELTKLEPSLLDGLAGAYHYTCDGHIRPSMLMSEFKRCLLSAGVTIRENCRVTGFNSESGTLKSIPTESGEMEADQFVVALGAWSPEFSKELGFNIPIQPGKGYSITMSRPDNCPKHGCLFQEVKVVATPWKSGYRLGSTMEFSGYDSSLNSNRLNALRLGAAQYMHDPIGDTVEEEWTGFRPMTTDGLPIIDYSPALKNVIVAAGHNMLGISMGPGTGKLISEMMSNEELHIDKSPYRISRF